MGECIISRRGKKDDGMTIIPVPGYHVIGVTLKTEDGRPIANCPLNCKDGSRYYNYTTNEKGQCIFTTNSGSANILILNSIDGLNYRDIVQTWKNVDAPIGGTSLINISHNMQSVYFTNKTEVFYTMCNRMANIAVTGGGGGGAPGFVIKSYMGSNYVSVAGGGGGSGYLNSKNNTKFSKGYHSFVSGSGGSGGIGGNFQYISNVTSNPSTNARTGGTSYLDSGYTAIGGNPGKYNEASISNRSEIGGIGGLGNGSTYTVSGSTWLQADNGENSPITWAGGGGAIGGGQGAGPSDPYLPWIGGSPYGGNGAYYNYRGWYYWEAKDGTNSGGGGGGAGFRNDGTGSSFKGGNGGSGTMRIQFLKLAD